MPIIKPLTGITPEEVRKYKNKPIKFHVHPMFFFADPYWQNKYLNESDKTKSYEYFIINNLIIEIKNNLEISSLFPSLGLVPEVVSPFAQLYALSKENNVLKNLNDELNIFLRIPQGNISDEEVGVRLENVINRDVFEVNTFSENNKSNTGWIGNLRIPQIEESKLDLDINKDFKDNMLKFASNDATIRGAYLNFCFPQSYFTIFQHTFKQDIKINTSESFTYIKHLNYKIDYNSNLILKEAVKFIDTHNRSQFNKLNEVLEYMDNNCKNTLNLIKSINEIETNGIYETFYQIKKNFELTKKLTYNDLDIEVNLHV